jgi:uncharacterized protein
MRVVLDANIYVSALVSDKGNPAKIINRWLDGTYEVLVSQAIIDEILRVTGYERIQRKYARVQENRLEFVALLMEQAIWTDPESKISAITADESDNRYLECAVAGRAAYVVSGDEHLLALSHYHGIEILTPTAFVMLLETGKI